MHARLSPRNRTGNSYDAMSAIIRAAQAAGYSKLKNINKALSSKTFTFPRYGGNTGR